MIQVPFLPPIYFYHSLVLQHVQTVIQVLHSLGAMFDIPKRVFLKQAFFNQFFVQTTFHRRNFGLIFEDNMIQLADDRFILLIAIYDFNFLDICTKPLGSVATFQTT